MDAVFRALADPTRRRLLDRLNRRNGQTLQELTADLAISRQAVSKHLAVLESAGLVVALRKGRARLHFLNAAPINEIADRWIRRYDRPRARMLAELKWTMEDDAMQQTAFVYVTYIKTTPQKLWQALTDHAFIRRYFEETGPESDWTEGAPVRWSTMPGEPHRDLGQVVLESDPPRRLAYTWHNYQPEMQAMFGWSDEQFERLVKEPISQVAFEIEPMGSSVKLTAIHDGFVEGSEMLQGVSQGWPMILSNLKTMLETDETLAFDTGA